VLLCLFVAIPCAGAGEGRTSTVGLPARIEGLVLPGPELEARPIDRGQPVVLCIVHVQPHGTACRYDLEYYGLAPGTFDLKDYLQRKDGSSVGDLPALPITIQSLLPPGQVLPHELEARGGPRLGGYRLALLVTGVLWVLGLLAILLVGRRRAKAVEAAARPRTLADYLRPLVEGALAGKLPPARLAELERTLMIYWSRRLGLGDRKPADALAELRRHPEAGPLLRQLEAWLHRPGDGSAVDVAGLLGPYQHVAAAELGEGAPGA
jgi:hypothetical protein